MSEEPSDSLLAILIGISEKQVTQYRRETLLLADGSWLVHFEFFMPKELRHKLTGSFTLLLKPSHIYSDCRSDSPLGSIES